MPAGGLKSKPVSAADEFEAFRSKHIAMVIASYPRVDRAACRL